MDFIFLDNKAFDYSNPQETGTKAKGACRNNKESATVDKGIRNRKEITNYYQEGVVECDEWGHSRVSTWTGTVSCEYKHDRGYESEVSQFEDDVKLMGEYKQE